MGISIKVLLEICNKSVAHRNGVKPIHHIAELRIKCLFTEREIRNPCVWHTHRHHWLDRKDPIDSLE